MSCSRPNRSPHPKMGGMSLMEILIAMAIGLIGIVVITQTYLVNENYKRSTTSAGGAQTNGSLALFSVERDARMAGWGLAWSTVFGCGGVQWYYNGVGYSSPPAAGPLPAALVAAPIVITDGGASPDTITIFYGSNTERVIPATVGANMVTASDPIQVDNPQGFSNTPGDLVLVVQNTNCAMLQVTDLAGGQIGHAPGVTAPYNPAGSTLPIFGAGAQVFNLGRPVVNTYSINNNSLQLASLFTATSSTVVPGYTPTPFAIVDNIVDLQAEYGKDDGSGGGTANDGIVDGYDAVTPTTVAGWQQVLSVRIGVLARSEFYVKPENVGDPCSATTVAPTWQGGTFNVPGGIPSCHGYRVFETVVPLRNMIWRQG